jgi:hypothetical protein
MFDPVKSYFFFFFSRQDVAQAGTELVILRLGLILKPGASFVLLTRKTLLSSLLGVAEP